MIPAEFTYVRVASIDEALQALGDAEDAKVLAGGHSLLPLMKLRLAFPETLVDVGRVEEMKGVREDGDAIVIGAAVTHHDVVVSDLVRQHCGVICDVTAKVGDPQVRHRGTHGGSLAHGDAASDMPGMALALGAQFTVAGPGGRRTVEAADFFVDYLQTAVGEDEVLVEVSWPKLAAGTRWDYQKFTRVTQGWAIVGALAVVEANGSIGSARIGLTNMGSVPVKATAVESALAGVASDDADAIKAACEGAAEGTTPPQDLNADPAYREHLARVLTRRAVTAALA